MASGIISVTVYENWVKVADTLKDSQKGQFYTAIAHYALYGEEPELPAPLDAFFELLRPSIDVSNARKQAGSIGGNLAKEKRDQDESKPGSKSGSKLGSKLGSKSGSNEKENVNENEKEKENTLSARAPAYAHEADRIAGEYPRAKVGNYRSVVEAVLRAIGREIEDHPGTETDEAVYRVESGTIAYANAVKSWREKRYISDAVKFYDTGMYNHDPATWKECTGKTGGDADPWGLNNGNQGGQEA